MMTNVKVCNCYYLFIFKSRSKIKVTHLVIFEKVFPSNSYTMACPPVRGYNPQALASGLSYVQMDKHGITILYHQH